MTIFLHKLYCNIYNDNVLYININQNYVMIKIITACKEIEKQLDIKVGS